MKKGDEVFVRTLKRWGKLTKMLPGGQAEVQVESLRITCAQAELDTTAPKKYKYSHIKTIKKHHSLIKSGGDRKALAKLDLHGLRVEEALSRVKERVDQAIIHDLDRLEIVHGIGTGRILQAVHQYLATLSLVRFRLDERNPGVTWVTFE